MMKEKVGIRFQPQSLSLGLLPSDRFVDHLHNLLLLLLLLLRVCKASKYRVINLCSRIHRVPKRLAELLALCRLATSWSWPTSRMHKNNQSKLHSELPTVVKTKLRTARRISRKTIAHTRARVKCN